MMRLLHVTCALLTLATNGGLTVGGELLSSDVPIPDAIDHYVDEQNTRRGRPVAPPAPDHRLLRRTTLDLAGRIPTAAERNDYFARPADQRRTRLIERLAGSPDFDEHLRNVLSTMLLPQNPYHREFRDYVQWAVQQRRPWDAMFRDMLLPGTTEAPVEGAREFLRSRARDTDDLTNDTAVLFFGVNVSCAKCHDHPLVADWQQDHYYGMQAFFQRTFVSRSNDVLEKPFGSVTFRTTEGEEKSASLMFLNGRTAEDQTPEYSDGERKAIQEAIRELERNDKAENSLDVSFSPRAELVRLATADASNHFLARNIVNRTWARLMGVGIVDPPDQMHSGNPPSHPLMLDWLTRDFITHGYDLKRLILGVVASNAYARDSVNPSGDEPPGPQTFAIGATRPLTPRQLALSMLIAVQNPQRWTDSPPADIDNRIHSLRQQSEGLSREFEHPGAEFQVSVDEALFFSNNNRVQDDLLRDSPDRIVGALRDLSDDNDIVEMLWNSVYSREPAAEERDAALNWLQRESADRATAVRDLVWTTLASPEMRFNH